MLGSDNESLPLSVLYMGDWLPRWSAAWKVGSGFKFTLTEFR